MAINPNGLTDTSPATALLERQLLILGIPRNLTGLDCHCLFYFVSMWDNLVGGNINNNIFTGNSTRSIRFKVDT